MDDKNFLNKFLNWALNSGGSILVHDQEIISMYVENPDFPYLVSFSRTGSHWLRMIMELYFGKPALVRAFYFKNPSGFTCYHTHDMDLQLHRSNVIYLYRNPVETIYSQLCYYREDLNNPERRRHWTDLYARHLSKWLLQEDFTKKKTVLTYEGMKSDIAAEFVKICEHFGEELDASKLSEALEKVSKKELKNKSSHDKQVVNLSAKYQKQKGAFATRYGDSIYSAIYSVEPGLKAFLENQSNG